MSYKNPKPTRSSFGLHNRVKVTNNLILIQKPFMERKKKACVSTLIKKVGFYS